MSGQEQRCGLLHEFVHMRPESACFDLRDIVENCRPGRHRQQHTDLDTGFLSVHEFLAQSMSS